jgi:hypothetical protein
VKLAWESESQYLCEKTWTNFSENLFLNDFLSCFEWKYCAVSQNVIVMSFIYLHFSNSKFLTFCSIDWFRFQKPLAISPFRIPRCQDFWDKSLGWFLGFQFKLVKLVNKKGLGIAPWHSITCTQSYRSFEN